MYIGGRILVICSSHRPCETQMLCTGAVRRAGTYFYRSIHMHMHVSMCLSSSYAWI